MIYDRFIPSAALLHAIHLLWLHFKQLIMNNDWQNFLSDHRDVLDKQDTPDTYLDKTYLCNLAELGLIKASGEDALSFLHGQFTNDLNQVNPNLSQLSSYCNAKGRMLAIFRVFKKDDDFYLILRRDVLEVVLKKLTMFKLMAKVDLTDASDELVLFGIAGPDSDSILSEINISAPAEVDHCIQENENTIIRIQSESSRLLFVSKPEKAISLWKSLSEKTIQTNSDIWDLHDIQSGIAQVTAETSEAFIPQMVNLELIGGVNFQKGCYPGQEIVARTHYLGKPNRRMYRISIDTITDPLPGTNIFSTKDGEQPVGKIVSSKKSSNDNSNALAVLRTAKENDNELHLESLTGAKITIQKLPYSLESEAT
jgi:folate-binding protein YgfZ